MMEVSFGKWFAEAYTAADVPGRAHGPRKEGRTTADDRGAGEAQLDAIFRWRGRGTGVLLARKANQQKLAAEAA